MATAERAKNGLVSAVSFGRAVGIKAAEDPDRPAITFEGRTITRAEFDRRTNRLARAYEHLGVVADSLVTIALPNGIEFYEACVAAWKLGATPQPVSARLPQRERDAIVELAEPALVVGVDAEMHPGHHCVPPGFEPDPALSDEPMPDRIASAWKAPTSGGSTGRPKLIVATTPATTDLDADPPLMITRDGVMLVPGPLYHNGPFVWSTNALVHGNHLIVMSRFDAALALEHIERFRVDYVLMVPTMMLRIWRLPEAERLARDVSSLRIVFHLAAPCPPWLKEAWIDWLGPERILELYAGTEAQAVTWITGVEWLAHKGSVGKPLTGEMRIVAADGSVLPPGEVGEVFMRSNAGPTYRYIGAEAKQRDVAGTEAGDPWESLGDMGWMDEEGYLYLADRQTDMILAGGANIYPAEIESALDEHPGVMSSAVIGLPDDDLGSRIHAIVQASGVSDDELRTFLAERLVRYKIPRSFEFVAEPLRDDAGKVRRSALREARLSS